MFASGCLLPADAEHLNQAAMAVASTYIFDQYPDGKVPDRFWNLVVSTVEDHLVASLDDCELPSLDEVEAA